jgi:hypothetical protein
MHVNNYHARDALDRVRAIRHPSQMHARTLRIPFRPKIRATRRRDQQLSENCSQTAQSSDLVERHGERNLGDQRVCSLWKKHCLYDKQSRNIGEWLDLCGIDLYENGVCWPRDELDELPDLRLQPRQTSGQCIAWQIFKDDRAAHLPPFEELVSRLDINSCRDAC